MNLLERIKILDESLFLPAFILLVLLSLFFFVRKKVLLSNWNIFIDSFEFSSLEFYEKVQSKLKQRDIKGISFGHSYFAESHFFSKRRKYLSVTWKHVNYKICFAPFGKGMFASYWVFNRQLLLDIVLSLVLPILGPLIVRKIFPQTYYKYDTSSMFMSVVHLAVTETINEITEAVGLKPLSEQASKPILQDIFKR